MSLNIENLSELPMDTLLNLQLRTSARLEQAKQDEHAIRMAILSREEVYARREGSLSNEIGDYKVTTVARMNRKVNPAEYAEIQEHIPAKLNPFKVETVVKLDIQKLRKLEEIEPELHKYCCRAIEEKPGTVSVKVEDVS